MSSIFFNSQPDKNIERYVTLLKKVGLLSNLFSDSKVPYLYYRAAENIFCKAFEADNHSRSDSTADAGKNGLGIGLKTFINGSGKSFQKIAEFDKNRHLYTNFKSNPEQLIRIVSILRNKRIDFAKSAHELNDFIYHCIAREPGKFLVFEEVLNYIAIDQLNLTSIKNNNIYFTDGNEEYNFNISKSTLFKRFITQNPFSFDVLILDDPYSFLEKTAQVLFSTPVLQKIYLPLYSKKSGIKYIPEKSGLNQWNASGRTRSEREVYIRVPLWIHRAFPQFFPPKDQSFNLKLPNAKIMSAKICQQGGKALMSNPNKALGEWLIGKVLKINPGIIVTYSDLEDVGIDTVEIRKIDDNNFEIDFKTLETFDRFEEELTGT